MNLNESWKISKPLVSSPDGIVVSQHAEASEAGATILNHGGNAMDAAIATAFCLGVVEPWQSGIGGVGHLVSFNPSNNNAFGVNFRARSPRQTNVHDYPLTGNVGNNMFRWPEVQGDLNVEGPASVCVPGVVDGLYNAHKASGKMPWHEVLLPAIELAKKGFTVDCFSSFRIASAMEGLARFKATRNTFLPNGFPPAPPWTGEVKKINIPNLASTYQQIAIAGGRDFYEGDLSEILLNDFKDQGIKIDKNDLASYRSDLFKLTPYQYRNSHIYTIPDGCAGSTLTDMLKQLTKTHTAAKDYPDEQFYKHVVNALISSKNLAPPLANPKTCTTHISVVDKQGFTVSLTQTLLALFGSRVLLPDSGVLMNNGMMWFNPEPNRKDSISGAQYINSNMCPTIINSDDSIVALGASGGRRILPSIAQLTTYLVDYQMDLHEAASFARLDIDNDLNIVIDSDLKDVIKHRLQPGIEGTFRFQENISFPNFFGCPNLAAFDKNLNVCQGAAFIQSPWSTASSPKNG